MGRAVEDGKNKLRDEGEKKSYEMMMVSIPAQGEMKTERLPSHGESSKKHDEAELMAKQAHK